MSFSKVDGMAFDETVYEGSSQHQLIQAETSKEGQVFVNEFIFALVYSRHCFEAV